jgi:hypothetical protein
MVMAMVMVEALAVKAEAMDVVVDQHSGTSPVKTTTSSTPCYYGITHQKNGIMCCMIKNKL